MKWAVWPLALMAAMLMLAITAAAPAQQDERQLGPYLPDYYSGQVSVQGGPAPEGTLVVACIVGCASYQTQAVAVDESGRYGLLEIAPNDRLMIGAEVTFHIVNQYGSIQASETQEFHGSLGLYTQNLTFSAALPVAPTPTPVPTATPLPTATPVPTATPPPTATPEPTATPTPEPTAIPEPTPTAILPVTGDTAVTRIPPLVIAGGIALALAGGALLYAASRRGRAATERE